MSVEKLALKNKLSMLWILMGIGEIAGFWVDVFDPSTVAQVQQGTLPWIPLPYLGVMILIPFVMAFLSQSLNDSANRWTNIILGVVFTVIDISGLATIPIFFLTTSYNALAFLYLMNAATVVSPALVAWFAYKWPKEAVQPIKAPAKKGEITA